MKTNIFESKDLLTALKKQKLMTLSELKLTLGTKSSMTIFRKLNELNYISSCSHSGKYYSLKRLARFNKNGLWTSNGILFSNHGTLMSTIKALTDDSEKGYTALELEVLLGLKPNEALLSLVKKRDIYREKILSSYVYFSQDLNFRRSQILSRKDVTPKLMLKPKVLMNELKAAIIIFFSVLDERQRRLYAGLESMKLGSGGDKVISELLDINIKTVNRGRRELAKDKIDIDTIRGEGGGRKEIKKKLKS